MRQVPTLRSTQLPSLIDTSAIVKCFTSLELTTKAILFLSYTVQSRGADNHRRFDARAHPTCNPVLHTPQVLRMRISRPHIPRWAFPFRPSWSQSSTVGLDSAPFRCHVPFPITPLPRKAPGHIRGFSSSGPKWFMLDADSTIYALSTAPGRAAIAVVRVSGPACVSV